MANYLKITKMPPVEVLNSDVVIEVGSNNDKVGELRLSKGSFDFYKKGAKSKHYRLSWIALAELIEKHGTERS